MTTNISNIDELIKTQNPFAGHLVVKPQQIWGKSFPDVPSINAHASNAVFDAVEKICKGQRTTVGITITAERGLGKSHIISRIRHQLQTREDSLFIYMSKYDNLNQIKYEFLQSIASSLRAFSNQKVMQWQEIATALINESRKWNHPPEKYISNKFSTKVVEQLTKEILLIRTNINNPYIVKAILWTLSTDYVVYANRWLSGLELTPEEAKAMGLPNPKQADREIESLRNVRQILDITSYYRVPVICFDELDNADVADNGLTTAQVIGSLVKDLYNNIKSGVFLLAMYSETWNDQIRFLPQAEAAIDRLVSEKSDRQPIELQGLNSDEIVALVKKWLQEFYQEHQQIPPHPLYPFNENKLREFGKQKPTIRTVLKWCGENFIPAIPPPLNPVKRFFQGELANIETSINSLIDDELAITAALKVGFLGLAKYGVEVESVKIEGVEEIITTKADQGYLNFRIVGNNRKVKIGILILQRPSGAFIGAALKRLIHYEKFDFTRGCLIRSKKINPGASVPQQCLKNLKEQTGKWILLRGEDIKSLLAISSIYYNCRNYELTEEQIFEFIKEEKIAINNPLIREILCNPSGQEPTDLTGYGFPVAIPKSIDNAE